MANFWFLAEGRNCREPHSEKISSIQENAYFPFEKIPHRQTPSLRQIGHRKTTQPTTPASNPQPEPSQQPRGIGGGSGALSINNLLGGGMPSAAGDADALRGGGKGSKIKGKMGTELDGLEDPN